MIPAGGSSTSRCGSCARRSRCCDASIQAEAGLARPGGTREIPGHQSPRVPPRLVIFRSSLSRVRRRSTALRDNLTIYDAARVVLAEAMDTTLLTGDGRHAKPRASMPIENLQSP